MTDIDDLPEGPMLDAQEHSSARPVRTEHAKASPHPDKDDLVERAHEEERALGVEDSQP
jgi:hypothetical protein